MKKIAAFSLIESVVSMVILIVIYYIGISIYLQSAQITLNKNKLNAQFLVDSIVSHDFKEQFFVDEEFQFDSLIVEKKYTNYKNVPDLILMDVACYEKNRTVLLANVKKIINKND